MANSVIDLPKDIGPVYPEKEPRLATLLRPPLALLAATNPKLIGHEELVSQLLKWFGGVPFKRREMSPAGRVGTLLRGVMYKKGWTKDSWQVFLQRSCCNTVVFVFHVWAAYWKSRLNVQMKWWFGPLPHRHRVA